MIFLWKSGSKLMAENGSILLAIDNQALEAWVLDAIEQILKAPAID